MKVQALLFKSLFSFNWWNDKLYDLHKFFFLNLGIFVVTSYLCGIKDYKHFLLCAYII